ncbi:MAG: SPOR domain-containing protein [Cytophagales bacterium]|nr:SPOR domain-containing protein [Cytophaga sp.]
MNLLMQVVAIIGMITMSSCAAMSQKNKNAAAEYYEDLSDVRPSFKSNTSQSTAMATVKPAEAEIKLYKDDSKALNSKLDTIAAVNQRVQTAQGYRILVYAGLSSDESQKMRQLVYSYNSDLNVYTQYRQPSFRVKVGDFQDRVEASYILNDLKKSFPSAMIVPDQINLVR